MAKTRRPRKLKKAVNKALIAYDLSSVPTGWTLENVMEAFHHTGVIFYDSYSISGQQPIHPRVLSRNNKRIKIQKYEAT